MPAADIFRAAPRLTLLFLPSKLGDSVLLFLLNTAFWSLMFELVVNLLYVCLPKNLDQGSDRDRGGRRPRAGALALRRNGMELAGPGVSIDRLRAPRATFGFTTGVLLLRLFSIKSPIKTNFGALMMLALTVTPLALPDSSRTTAWSMILRCWPSSRWPSGWARTRIRMAGPCAASPGWASQLSGLRHACAVADSV